MDESFVRLRQEVEICAFDDGAVGKTSYLITFHNRNWKVTQSVYAVCCILKEGSDIDNAYATLAESENHLSEETLVKIIDFLKSKGLIVGFEPTEKHKPLRNKMLWGRVTLIPSFLVGKTGILRFLFLKPVFFPLITIFAVWLMYVYITNSPSVISEQIMGLSLTSLVLCYAYLILTGFAHELGHAVALRKHGEKPGRIGFGMFFIMPVLFSDVTRAWKLKRKERFVVDIGGIYFQGISLLVLYFVNLMFINSHELFLGIMLSSMAVLTNFNPFIKMDGYWMFSDALGIDDLHKMVFGLIKYPFKRKRGMANPIGDLSKAKKIAILVYLTATLAFFAYFLSMITHSIALAVALIRADLQTLFSSVEINIGVIDVFSYISSRIPSLIVLIFMVRMVYMLLKKMFIAIKNKKKDVCHNEDN